MDAQHSHFKQLFHIFFVSLLSLIFCFPSYSADVESTLLNVTHIQSWNHTSKHSPEYAQLQHPKENYELQIQSADSTPEIKMTLVKKLVDWREQHSNGLKLMLSDFGMSFGEFEELSFTLQVDGTNARVVSTSAELIAPNPWLQEKSRDLTPLASERANFMLTLYGKENDDQSIATPLGQYKFDVEVNDSGSKFTTLRISQQELAFFWQQNYNETPCSLESIQALQIVGAILVAESGNGKVSRNYARDIYSDSAVEVFNELPVNISQLTLVRKQR